MGDHEADRRKAEAERIAEGKWAALPDSEKQPFIDKARSDALHRLKAVASV
jgi:hypothetical protein